MSRYVFLFLVLPAASVTLKGAALTARPLPVHTPCSHLKFIDRHNIAMHKRQELKRPVVLLGDGHDDLLIAQIGRSCRSLKSFTEELVISLIQH